MERVGGGSSRCGGNTEESTFNLCEDDLQLPMLTPNSLIFANSNVLPELESHHIEEHDLRRRSKHLFKCKEAVWKR